MIKPAVLDAMVAAGCSAQQIAAAVKADQSCSSGAERQARYRSRKASQSDERDITSVTVTDTVSPKKETSPTPPKEKTTPSTVSEARASSTVTRATKAEFEDWYRHYPHKVQRGAAEKAFLKALSLASLEDLIAGVARYVSSKPADRQWQNPATWLNGKGWLDAPAGQLIRNANIPPGNRRRTAVDVARERFEGRSDGSEDIFGSHGNVEFLPARLG